MAMPLEETIMTEVGLGMHFNWFNGSGSCEYVRRHAVDLLTEAIQKHHDAGEQIAAPNAEMIALAREATRWDDSQYVLTKSWQVTTEVIATHIHGFYEPEEKRANWFREMTQNLRRCYQPAHKQQIFYDGPDFLGRLDREWMKH